MQSFMLAGESDKKTDDVEATIQRAKRTARGRGAAVDVVNEAGTDIAKVWPDGKVDVTWEGNRYA